MVETNVFTRSSVAELLKEHFVESRLHTDHHVLELKQRNRVIQQELVGTGAIPYYVVLDPVSGRELGQWNVAMGGFDAFLPFIRSMVKSDTGE